MHKKRDNGKLIQITPKKLRLIFSNGVLLFLNSSVKNSDGINGMNKRRIDMEYICLTIKNEMRINKNTIMCMEYF